MKNRLLVLAVLFAMGCVAEDDVQTQASEIVGGQVFTGIPAVGAIMVDGEMGCTGTLIEKRKVLTAGHCLDPMIGKSVRFNIGPIAASPIHSIPVSGGDKHDSEDIAYLILASDAPVAPMDVLRRPMDASWVGRTLFFVGYGDNDGWFGTGSGIKRSVGIAIDEINSTQFSHTVGYRNTCFGDSGGPAFWKDPATNTLKVVGVTAFGDGTCSEYGVDARVDPFLSFLGLTGAQAAPAPAAPVAAAPADPCNGETYVGRCAGNTLIWCEAQKVETLACTTGCGFQAAQGYNNCL